MCVRLYEMCVKVKDIIGGRNALFESDCPPSPVSPSVALLKLREVPLVYPCRRLTRVRKFVPPLSEILNTSLSAQLVYIFRLPCALRCRRTIVQVCVFDQTLTANTNWNIE